MDAFLSDVRRIMAVDFTGTCSRMFERIKRAFGKEAQPEAAPSSLHAGPVSEWAATRGFGFSVDGTGQNIALEGKVGGKPWKIVLGKPTRNYIFGEEVRGRSQLGIDE